MYRPILLRFMDLLMAWIAFDSATRPDKGNRCAQTNILFVGLPAYRE